MRPSTAQLRRPFIKAAIGALAIFLAACATPSGVPEPEPGSYTGPPIAADTLAGEHILVATLPAPGYEFTLEGTREAFRSQDVFVSLRRPNPAVLYPQVVVELRLSTGIPMRTPVRVFARVVDFSERSGPAPREALLIPGAATDPSKIVAPDPAAVESNR